MCRLVKLKLLGRVGTFHNSPGQPPEAQNHPKRGKLFPLPISEKRECKNLTRNLMIPVVLIKSKIQFLTFLGGFGPLVAAQVSYEKCQPSPAVSI
eukprot:sb/3479247/